MNTLPSSGKGNFFSHAACQFQKTSTSQLSLYWVPLGFERLSKETSSLQVFGGRNWEDLLTATSSISQNCNQGCQCKVWLLVIKWLKWGKNKTAFIILTNNYVHALLMKQKNTRTDCFCGLSVFGLIVIK